MYASNRWPDGRVRRRGIVLVLILGMLALLALIGVTFASLASQAQVSSRKYAETLLIPDAEKMFDYGLNQLINDTQNPLSGMFGHSLLRDMYGNDAQNNGGPLGPVAVTFVSRSFLTDGNGNTVQPPQLIYIYSTNIPAYVDPARNLALMGVSNEDYGKSPIGWQIVFTNPNFASQSLEIVDAAVINNFLVITTSAPDGADLTDTTTPINPILTQPPGSDSLTVQNQATNCYLDGRYLNGFNGIGQTSYALSKMANSGDLRDAELYRLPNHFKTGLGVDIANNLVPMDEDYDACDLENMFLALESADGSVIIPSFHRPSIIRYQVDGTTGLPVLDDWIDLDTVSALAGNPSMSSGRILRPRLIDNPTSGLKDLKPDQTTGKIEYDIDNDGDGVTDSVWLDLGYPAQRDANGKLYKPLFSFKVIGTNGKLPLNSAGNLQGRSLVDRNGLNGAIDNLPDNDLLWDHTSHLGYSVNEINPKYALQNDPNRPEILSDSAKYQAYHPQQDNGLVSIAVTQLRSLLAGTRPQPAPAQVSVGANPSPSSTPGYEQPLDGPIVLSGTNLDSGGNIRNGDRNYVWTHNGAVLMPNHVADLGSNLTNSGTVDNSDFAAALSLIYRNTDAVPGLWGEPRGVPSYMPGDAATLGVTGQDLTDPTNNINRPGPVTPGVVPHRGYHSRVGPGRSPSLAGYNTQGVSDGYLMYPYPIHLYDDDGTNDTYAAMDFYPARPELGGAPVANPTFNILQLDSFPANFSNRFVDPLRVSTEPLPLTTPMTGVWYEFGLLPSERARLFVTPADISGNGWITPWLTAPTAANPAGFRHDGINPRGYGPDRWGRVSYFNYFRPAGVPSYIDYRARRVAPGQYNALSILPDNVIPPATTPDGIYGNDLIGDTRHNRYHGYESARAPEYVRDPSDDDVKAEESTNRQRPTFYGESFMGVMPYNVSDTAMAAIASSSPPNSKYPPRRLLNQADGSYLGTMNGLVNTMDSTKSKAKTNNNPTQFRPVIYGSMPYYDSTTINLGPDAYPGGSLGRDLAHEVNLYAPSPTDAPFTSADLEWLYRQQDIDGKSLDSRLKYLAPISFVYSNDAAMRRKLFSVETWDINNFTWAYDNPAGVFPGNNSFGPATLGAYADGNASVRNYRLGATTFNAANIPLLPSNRKVAAPAYGHRNRKINLNAPLPTTNDPDDPVRQKWVYEAYQALKQILPPKSLDTPEELLGLSQYLLNTVDFRDPDAAMTHFINPDVRMVPPVEEKTSSDPPPAYATYVLRTGANLATTQEVHQYGMEYSPIAINEALAYQFNRRNNTTGNPEKTPRLWLELVNTLTRASTERSSGNNASDIDPTGWEIAITPDDPWGRPDPVTGQIVSGQPKRKGNPNDPAAVETAWPKKAGFSGPLKALGIDFTSVGDQPGGNADIYYYVVGSANPADVDATHPMEAGMPGSPDYFGPDPGEKNPPTGGNQGSDFKSSLRVPTQLKTSGVLSGKLLDIDEDGMPSGTADGKLDITPGAFYWIHLRRPANPLDPDSSKVTVDSIRIPYVNDPATAAPKGAEVEVTGGKPVDTDNTMPTSDKKKLIPDYDTNYQAIYSTHRFQPYRGGQLIPTLTKAGGSAPDARQADYRYGFSEQHRYTYPTENSAPAASDPPYFGLGLFSLLKMAAAPGTIGATFTQVPTTNRIYHTLGRPNNYGINGKPPLDNWSHFPFNDREFTSVVELTKVPASPPGLFTKQFIASSLEPYEDRAKDRLANIGSKYRRQFPFAGSYDPAKSPRNTSPDVTTGPPHIEPNGGDSEGTRINDDVTVLVYPYLSDNFFYTAAGDLANTSVGGVGGATGAGWHKMFELFEVPASSYGAIGPVASGTNGDWYREDRRPGQINLNLIIDEEVFFGLIDDESIAKAKLDKSLMKAPIDPNTGNPIYYPDPTVNPAAPADHPMVAVPRVVTQIDANGYPTYTVAGGAMTWTGSYAMQNRGFDTGDSGFDPMSPGSGLRFGLMKSAFADFLKLRHGGSGFLFSYGIGQLGGLAPVGSGPVGQIPNIYAGGTTTTPAMDRPFHSASYPDIDFTVMRPATLPPMPGVGGGPSTIQLLNAQLPLALGHTIDHNGTWLDPPPLLSDNATAVTPLDPGVKTIIDPITFNLVPRGMLPPTAGAPTDYRPSNPLPDAFADRRNWLPPAIPPRRLFQIPDTAAVPGPPMTRVSNATVTGDSGVMGDNSIRARTYVPLAHPTLGTPVVPLALGGPVPNVVSSLVPIVNAAGIANPLLLGGFRNEVVTLPVEDKPSDTRQHPLFRTEWLEKVVNLSTVRTHQYAVWITVGFFEVAQAGDPTSLTPDILGPEIGAASGLNVRYRGFFVLDRTKATGFDPNNPGDFRKVVTFRRRIE